MEIVTTLLTPLACAANTGVGLIHPRGFTSPGPCALLVMHFTLVLNRRRNYEDS